MTATVLSMTDLGLRGALAAHARPAGIGESLFAFAAGGQIHGGLAGGFFLADVGAVRIGPKGRTHVL